MTRQLIPRDARPRIERLHGRLCYTPIHRYRRGNRCRQSYRLCSGRISR